MDENPYRPPMAPPDATESPLRFSASGIVKGLAVCIPPAVAFYRDAFGGPDLPDRWVPTVVCATTTVVVLALLYWYRQPATQS